MSRRTRHPGRIAAGAVSGVAIGLLPVAAMALGANNTTTRVAAEPCVMSTEAPAETIKGAPYSGVGTSEIITTLADGNRITRTNTMRYFRDSAGRTRTEYQLAAIGPFVPDEAQSIVTITDPVAGRRYVLHPGLKRAEVFKLGEKGAAQGPTGAIFVGSAFAVNGTMPSSAAPSSLRGSGQPIGARAGIQRRTRGDRDSSGIMTAPGFGNGNTNIVIPMGGRVSMSTEQPGGAPAPSFDVLTVNNGTPTLACRSGSAKGAEPVSIGERRIEGLKVTGSRLEFTLDPGSVGNDQPITVRTDQWFSPDLGVVVSSSNHDPMMGDTTYRLEQINRTEPDAALFEVPADYTRQGS